ncbi:DUF742 domain-containing protein [Micromonospora sp. NPDC050417]|uniref:DUF742 domain-containing protein n=1 Tax=Micromonospora sp. NPDC050417 TaxID=3364280 RepID=UPI003790BC30
MAWEAMDEAESEPTFRIRPYLGTSTPVEQLTGPKDHATDGTAAGPATPAPRPFVLTSGRVAGVDPALTLETQVTARVPALAWGAPELSRLAPELRNIVLLCREPISVAEISAWLRLHLDVTKILVGDLRAAGYLDVHTRDIHDSPDPDLILRVINGLRAIS